jgi:hypothetical protein
MKIQALREQSSFSDNRASQLHPPLVKVSSDILAIETHKVVRIKDAAKESREHISPQWTLFRFSKLLCISTATHVRCFCIRGGGEIINFQS